MELAGLEPATSWVRSRRSPNYQSKLNLGNRSAQRSGRATGRGRISVLQQRTGLPLYAATNVVHSGHCVACPDQNGKSDQDFRIGSPPGPNGGIVPEPPAAGPGPHRSRRILSRRDETKSRSYGRR